ncbi:MAG TPA: mannitol dehydrogenase family protein [Arthrobacter sp.]|nr:mannitol dehydrogenase family protein [Arthrobacter sp.]
MTTRAIPELNRTLRALRKAPVRIVHLGLGAFHRSHQAWYTHNASDASDWGIAAFTGRRPDAAEALAAQDGLFTLIERSEAGDTFEVIGSIVEAVDGADLLRLAELVAAPATSILTLTITEAAYRVDGEVIANRAAAAAGTDPGTPTTPLGRLVHALAARRAAGAGPLAVVSCDNLSDNATVARNAILDLAGSLDPDLVRWIAGNVSFVGTSVDRITPRTTPEDLAEVRESCGFRDNSAVVAEPFHNWVLSGEFPAGRPRWEDAGAVFVEEIGPYENRKLWLLNGAHSLLAYAGQLRGHATVAEALADPRCLAAVEAFWDEASEHLQGKDLDIPAYREALRARFGNGRIAHHLSQIAADGTTKLRMRALPLLYAERAQGRSGAASALMLASWIDYTATATGLRDPLSADIAAANDLDSDRRVAALLALVSPELAGDHGVIALVHGLGGTFSPPSGTTPHYPSNAAAPVSAAHSGKNG